MNRRLLNIRKNKKRYEKHGIRLSRTTKSDPHPSIVPMYAHIIEFALVRLRYRYGASIDDVLLDPLLSAQFEQMAFQIAPQLSPQDLRLGALYLRKSRHMGKKEKGVLFDLDLQVIDQAYTAPRRLSEIRVDEVPDSPGILELKEDDRHLYISRNDHLRCVIQQFATGHAFDVISSDFWKPDPQSVTVQYACGARFSNVNIGKWELRLIHDRDPVLNWPIFKTAA